MMTGVVKSDYSPKKGKENKNVSNHIPVPSSTLLVRKNAKNESKADALPTPKKEKVDNSKNAKNECKPDPLPTPKKVNSNNRSPGGVPKRSVPDDKPITKPGKTEGNIAPPPVQNGTIKEEEDSSSSSTSNRSVRPQTKILRRPTPNLKHPVIQVLDSDDSGADSSSSGGSDKAKDNDNPKRLKMGNGELNSNQDSSASNKRKNFIMYNKYNVDKNTNKNSKERTSATLVASIPNPCTSCNRSQAPERLHSHARKDARGLMNNSNSNNSRRSPAAMDVKMTSPQKKLPLDKTKLKDVAKSNPSSPINGLKNSENIKNIVSKHKTLDTALSPSSGAASMDVLKKSSSDTNCATSGVGVITEPKTPGKDFIEPQKACYICQKDFKVSELLLHESKCLETWKKTNNSLTPNLRQLPPRRPPDEGLCPLLSCDDDDEEEADPAWSAVQSQLIPCPLCGRTFFPERMPVHRRVCKGKPSPRPLKRASSLREQSVSSTDGEECKPAPLYLPCYVCGRNYGSWVLPMHEQQCLKKWRRENDKLAEGERQEEPRKINDEDVASLIELGDTAWESHLQQLVPCPRCSRTFFPDRLEIHQRSCKGPSCNRRPRSNKGI